MIPHRSCSRRSASPAHRFVPPALVLLLLTAGPAPLEANAEAPSARTAKDVPKDWNEAVLGSVPNRYGELFAVATQSEAITFLFRNTERELRLIEKSGNVLLNQTLVVTRLAADDKPPAIGSKETTEEGWVEEHAANIPAHFGNLVEMHGNRREGGVHLIFENEDHEIRVVRWNANGFDPRVRLYPRAPRKTSAGDNAAQEAARAGRTPTDTTPNLAPTETERTRWSDIEEGLLPLWLGHLRTVSSKNLRFIFCFESSRGDLHLVETHEGKRPRRVTMILREKLDREGERARAREIRDREEESGEKWTYSRVRTPVPEAFGELVEAAGIPAILLFRDGEGNDRFVTASDQIRTTFETIRRSNTDEKQAGSVEGWKRVEVGFVPASFGRLRALTSDPDNPKKHLYLFQSDSGVIHLVPRLGNKIGERSQRIDREY